MRRISSGLIAIFTLALLAGGCLQQAPTTTPVKPSAPAARAAPAPDDGGMPSARRVIDDYIEAIGGAAAIRKQRSAKASGTFSVPAAGLSGDMTIYAHAPNKTLVQVTLPGVGKTLEGYNGEVAWSLDPMQGPMIKQGKAAAQAEFQADLYAALHADDRYESMEVVEKTELEGQECYKIRLVTSNGDEVVEYYAVDSKLLVGTDMAVESPVGSIDVQARLGDYKKFGGVRVPTKIRQKMMNMEQVISIEGMEINSVDESTFDLPEEIKALVGE